jgi:hypothetical protein
VYACVLCTCTITSSFVCLAIRGFSVGTDTGSAERCLSTFGHIWNSRSNSLDWDRVRKLVFCYWNLRVLHKIAMGTAPTSSVAANWLDLEIEEDALVSAQSEASEQSARSESVVPRALSTQRIQTQTHSGVV